MLNQAHDQPFDRSVQGHELSTDDPMSWMHFDSNSVKQGPDMMPAAMVGGIMDETDISDQRWFEFLQQSGLSGPGVRYDT